MIELNLFTICSEINTDYKTGCFVSYSDPAYKLYHKSYVDWEKEVATPAIEKQGYKVQDWQTGDGDSFGPLTRVATTTKDGKTYQIIYG